MKFQKSLTPRKQNIYPVQATMQYNLDTLAYFLDLHSLHVNEHHNVFLYIFNVCDITQNKVREHFFQYYLTLIFIYLSNFPTKLQFPVQFHASIVKFFIHYIIGLPTLSTAFSL